MGSATRFACRRSSGLARSRQGSAVRPKAASCLPYVYDQTDAPPDLSTIVPIQGRRDLQFRDQQLPIGRCRAAPTTAATYNQTTGAMEYCRLMESQLGVVHGIVGNWQAGGNMNDFLDGTGVLNDAFVGPVANAGNKFRYFVYFDNGGNYSPAQWVRQCQAISAWLDSYLSRTSRSSNPSRRRRDGSASTARAGMAIRALNTGAEGRYGKRQCGCPRSV